MKIILSKSEVLSIVGEFVAKQMDLPLENLSADVIIDTVGAYGEQEYFSGVALSIKNDEVKETDLGGGSKPTNSEPKADAAEGEEVRR